MLGRVNQVNTRSRAQGSLRQYREAQPKVVGFRGRLHTSNPLTAPLRLGGPEWQGKPKIFGVHHT